MGYRLTGITRPELSQETAKQSSGTGEYGEVPAEILSGELRAHRMRLYAPFQPRN